MTLPTRQIYFNHCDSKRGIPIGIEGASCFSYLGRLYSGGLLGADGVLLQVAMLVNGSCQLDSKVTSVHVLLKESISSSYLPEEIGFTVYTCMWLQTLNSLLMCTFLFLYFPANSCKFMFFHGQGKLFLVCNHGNSRNKLSLKCVF